MVYKMLSRTSGKIITFSVYDNQVYVDLNGREGRNGTAARKFGQTTGDRMLTFHERDPISFKYLCRRWWRKFEKDNPGYLSEEKKIIRITGRRGAYYYYDESDGSLLGGPFTHMAHIYREAWERGYSHKRGKGVYERETEAITPQYRKGQPTYKDPES